MRLDLALVHRKLAGSRTLAQAMITEQRVFVLKGEEKVLLSKASYDLSDHEQLFVEPSNAERFVSRGGLKLEGALVQLGLDVQNLICLDIGLSTGGFTDCLLQRGAERVFGVDVGTEQLHPRIKTNPRVTYYDKINARHLRENSDWLATRPAKGFDLIVMDVSFISMTLLLPTIVAELKKGSFLLSLVKPQFEVGPEGLGKGGIVKDRSLFTAVENRIKNACQEAGLTVRDYFPSVLEGKDGNQEFFVFAEKL